MNLYVCVCVCIACSTVWPEAFPKTLLAYRVATTTEDLNIKSKGYIDYILKVYTNRVLFVK